MFLCDILFLSIILQEVYGVIYLKVIDKQGALKFKEQGKNLKVSYNAEYAEGDKIRVDTRTGEYMERA